VVPGTRLAAGDYDADYTAAGSDSRAAQVLLQERFPDVAGETVTVVARADTDLADPRVRATVDSLLARLAELPRVAAVGSPYVPGGTAPDGRTGLAQVRLDADRPSAMPLADTRRIMDTVADAGTDDVAFAVSGQVVADVQNGQGGPETVGLVAALAILLLTFGSVIAAGLPVIVAVAGLALSSSAIGLLAAVMPVPPWAPALAAMLGIGVGIDYVLLMVTRYRENLLDGLAPRAAALATVDTAGRSVLVAGSTVIVSLLGLVLTGLPYLQGAAVAAMIAILVVMVASVTLLPALFGVTGARIDRLRIRRLTRTSGRGGSPRWTRWAAFVQRRSLSATAIGVALLVVLAMPVATVRFGLPDAGSDPVGTTSRTAYDWTAQAFGVGTNGPLVLAADLGGARDVAVLDRLATDLGDTAGVASVGPVQTNRGGDAAILTVVPDTGPQSGLTADLVQQVRDEVVPDATAGTDTVVHVGGATAAALDFNADIASRLPVLVVGVVVLAVLLLLVTFRSVAVAGKAALLNLLSIGAAFGVIALVLQGGWAGQLVGIDTPTPLPAYVPVLVFAILFGLSMDYEVFLVGRMHEHLVQTGDSGGAVATGLAATARVITAAAAIMVVVFASFVPSVNLTLKLIGVGLATAIAIDATVVRMLLVPAIMRLHGRYAWWLPDHLGRLLPRIRLEGATPGTADAVVS
jgi:RND superfamily putative drug exporter